MKRMTMNIILIVISAGFVIGCYGGSTGDDRVTMDDLLSEYMNHIILPCFEGTEPGLSSQERIDEEILWMSERPVLLENTSQLIVGIYNKFQRDEFMMKDEHYAFRVYEYGKMLNRLYSDGSCS